MNKKLIIIVVALVLIASGGVAYVMNRNSSGSSQGNAAQQPEAESGNGEPVTVTGTFTCLPHKQTDGPQTLECAFGLRTEDGTYYALRDSSTDYSLLGGVATDEKITVTGTLSDNPQTIYQDRGIITVTSVD